MNITKLVINGYKNLKVNLEHHAKVISLIGNNGSGKSNLLEALSSIFKNLYFGHKTAFDYRIEYTLNNQHVSISQNNAKLDFTLDNKPISDIANYLPKKVVAIYSGESSRLWEECYEEPYRKFISNMNSSIQLETPRMLLINKRHWHISLLTLLLSDSDDNKSFLKQLFDIEDNKVKIIITIDRSKYKYYKNNPVLELAKSIEHKNEYSLNELKEILLNKHSTNTIYTYLYILSSPKNEKIVTNISIKFGDKQNKILTIDSLSEGEKKLLLLKSAFEFAVQEDSLFLLDEPDAHIHINNKQHIIKLIEPFKHNRQVVLTTHSPTMTKSINNDELFMMDNGEIISKKEQEIIDHLTGDFWNRHQQSTFLSSHKPIILLVEGRHDKTHISNAFNKLKDDFPDLEFDIFHMDGASNIEHIIKGLYTCEIEQSKLFIGIVDDDDKGREVCTNLGKPLKDISRFYVFKYPKKYIEGFEGDFTVENLYGISKYEEAYKKVLQAFKFRPKSIAKISDNIEKCAKAILEEESKNYSKEDFKNFRPLFQKISDIYTIYQNTNTNHQPALSAPNLVGDSTNQSSDDISTGISADKDTAVNVSNDAMEVFYREAKGSYHPSTHTLTLKAGSKIRKDYIPSFSQGERDAREALMQEIGVKDAGETYETLNNYEFNTPSGAGKFVMNSNVNGKDVWKDSDGKSIKELFFE